MPFQKKQAWHAVGKGTKTLTFCRDRWKEEGRKNLPGGAGPLERLSQASLPSPLQTALALGFSLLSPRRDSGILSSIPFLVTIKWPWVVIRDSGSGMVASLLLAFDFDIMHGRQAGRLTFSNLSTLLQSLLFDVSFIPCAS